MDTRQLVVPSRQYSLDKCDKKKCLQCDMGYLLKNHIKAIFQCLTNDIKEYYMRLLTTKCLNTSVVMAYLLLGKRGITIANYCDTHEVRKRHREKKNENNTNLMDALEKKMMHPICKYRQLYYILITDAQFDHPDGHHRYFPGHVFIIEKIPGGSYYFHQSYINQYDYNGHIQRNKNSLRLNTERVRSMMQQIRYVIMNPTWDENTVKYWKEITFVDTTNMIGALSGGKMFLCFRKAKVTDCVERLSKYVKAKLRTISKMKMEQMHEIYGDKSAYDSDQHPLTVAEMKQSLEQLQKSIKLHLK